MYIGSVEEKAVTKPTDFLAVVVSETEARANKGEWCSIEEVVYDASGNLIHVGTIREWTKEEKYV